MSEQNINSMTVEQLQALVASLTAENAKLEAKAAPRPLTCKVSAKGALSVYGLGRFPVTLYRGQWERLIGHISHVEEFIKANESALKVKGEADATANVPAVVTK